MNKLLLLTIFVLSLLVATNAFSETYYVSENDGNDSNPGTAEKPFKTIQKAADVMKAGDTCMIAEGVYRETIQLKTSGKSGQEIVFMAMDDEEVILSGTEVITANWVGYFDYNRTWTDEGEKTFQTQGIRGKKNYTQLFVDGELMTKVDGPEKLDGSAKWFSDLREDDGEYQTRLVLWPPEEETVEGMERGYSNPLNFTIEARIRENAFVASGINYVNVNGIKYFATENKLEDCQNCKFE
jgi:hypothetical protein